MNVLFLGGNRFVGKALAERFLSFGYNVTVFNRQGTGPKGVKVIQGDRNQKGSLSKIPFIDFDIEGSKLVSLTDQSLSKNYHQRAPPKI